MLEIYKIFSQHLLTDILSYTRNEMSRIKKF